MREHSLNDGPALGTGRGQEQDSQCGNWPIEDSARHQVLHVDFVLDRRQGGALGHMVGSCRACAVAHGIATAFTSGAIKGQCQGITGIQDHAVDPHMELYCLMRGVKNSAMVRLHSSRTQKGNQDREKER